MAIDRFGRNIHYLRISLTDHCNLRCIYCMPEDQTFRPNAELMQDHEIHQLTGLFASLGFDKIRLTGGEPTVRAHVVEIVRGIASTPGIKSVSMTTNGILLKRLTDLNADITTASDGEQALKEIRHLHPDVVILDVMMPRKNGWEVCRAIRQDPQLAGTGVIMLTGIGSSLNEMTSPLYGADEYLDKPFDFGDLEAAIQRVIAARKQQQS